MDPVPRLGPTERDAMMALGNTGGGGMTQVTYISPSSAGTTNSTQASTSTTVAFASQPSHSLTHPTSTQKNCLFTADELRTSLLPTLHKLLSRDQESCHFKQPVDPKALGVPDYFHIIKRPMDLGTIWAKLKSGAYSDPWEYIDDVWLMFDNAWLYNRRTTNVYRCCTKLSQVFEQVIDPVMQSLGYCCGRKYAFSPQLLACSGKLGCTIPRDAIYYSYSARIRYNFCEKCFEDIQTDTVALTEDSAQPTTILIKKEEFIQSRNDYRVPEELVMCVGCGRKYHQICALHLDFIWPNGFTCDTCLYSHNTQRKENNFTAKRLASTELGTYLETRVNNFLIQKKAEAGEVFIRVVSSSNKLVDIKPGMKTRFDDYFKFNVTLPYRAKAIFAFQEIDGVDVCFFGMHVQEYGSDCPGPNARRVYVAYLDSIHFFQPKEFRTDVYHEIMIGYLEFVKRNGFTMAHIWASPPTEGDDYIFYAHPPSQKIPKAARLQEWYKKLLLKAIRSRVVLEYKDIVKQSLEENLTQAVELPYFEGDHWPIILEESIRELEQQEVKRRAAGISDALDVGDQDDIEGSSPKKICLKEENREKPKRKARQKKPRTKPGLPQFTDQLMNKLFAAMNKLKDGFYVVRLHSPQAAALLPCTSDPDPVNPCELMEKRDGFLTFCQDRHLEFSSLRRCKFSTLSMLYGLHKQSQDWVVYNCNSCNIPVEIRYHCTVCQDFDLCFPCYQKMGHEHYMNKVDIEDDRPSTPDPNQFEAQARANKLAQVKGYVASIIHACQCKEENCDEEFCGLMKSKMEHSRTCMNGCGNGCDTCTWLLTLCTMHTRTCLAVPCHVLFCDNVKRRVARKRVRYYAAQERLQQQRASMDEAKGASNVRTPTPPNGLSGNTNHDLTSAAYYEQGPTSSRQAGASGGEGTLNGSTSSAAAVKIATPMIDGEEVRLGKPVVVGYRPDGNPVLGFPAKHLSQRIPNLNTISQQPGSSWAMVSHVNGCSGSSASSSQYQSSQPQSLQPVQRAGCSPIGTPVSNQASLSLLPRSPTIQPDDVVLLLGSQSVPREDKQTCLEILDNNPQMRRRVCKLAVDLKMAEAPQMNPKRQQPQQELAQQPNTALLQRPQSETPAPNLPRLRPGACQRIEELLDLIQKPETHRYVKRKVFEFFNRIPGTMAVAQNIMRRRQLAHEASASQRIQQELQRQQGFNAIRINGQQYRGMMVQQTTRNITVHQQQGSQIMSTQQIEQHNMALMSSNQHQQQSQQLPSSQHQGQTLGHPQQQLQHMQHMRFPHQQPQYRQLASSQQQEQCLQPQSAPQAPQHSVQNNMSFQQNAPFSVEGTLCVQQEETYRRLVILKRRTLQWNMQQYHRNLQMQAREYIQQRSPGTENNVRMGGNTQRQPFFQYRGLNGEAIPMQFQTPFPSYRPIGAQMQMRAGFHNPQFHQQRLSLTEVTRTIQYSESPSMSHSNPASQTNNCMMPSASHPTRVVGDPSAPQMNMWQHQSGFSRDQ